MVYVSNFYIGNDNPELGEDELRQILSEFSCPVNRDVEQFLKKNSMAAEGASSEELVPCLVQYGVDKLY